MLTREAANTVLIRPIVRAANGRSSRARVGRSYRDELFREGELRCREIQRGLHGLPERSVAHITDDPDDLKWEALMESGPGWP